MQRYDWTGYQPAVPPPPARTLPPAQLDEDMHGGSPDPYDNLDYEDGNHDREGDVLKALIKQLEDLDTMTGPDLTHALSDLPVPQAGTVSGMSVAEAIAVTFCQL